MGDIDVGLISDYCSNKLFSITPSFRANCSTGERGRVGEVKKEKNRGLIKRMRLEIDILNCQGKKGERRCHGIDQSQGLDRIIHLFF